MSIRKICKLILHFLQEFYTRKALTKTIALIIIKKVRQKNFLRMKFSNNIQYWMLCSVMLLLNIYGTDGNDSRNGFDTFSNKSKNLDNGRKLIQPKCSSGQINISSHDASQEITIEKVKATTFGFNVSTDFEYYVCFVFRPNETYKYSLTDCENDNGTCISLFKNNYLQHSINSNLSRLTARNNEIEIDYQIKNHSEGQNSCSVDINYVQENDHGEWKVVIMEEIEEGSGDVFWDIGDGPEIHEFSQILNVKVHGNWSEDPGYCKCGDTNKTTRKFCDNPAPKNGGNNCTCGSLESCNGIYAEIVEPCPIDGNWSAVTEKCEPEM